jgi:hypothetical protein
MTKKVTKTLAFVVAGAALVGAAGFSATQARAVERGRYLVSAMGCNDCHTPFKMGPNGPEPDMSRALTGHPEEIGKLGVFVFAPGPWGMAASKTNTAFSGPWGNSYAANLTPDQNTGLGIWTEDMFLRAIRTGRHMGVSRPINPPMPWAMFRNLTDDDLKSIFAYLRSLKPVTNHVPDYEPPVEDAKKSSN